MTQAIDKLIALQYKRLNKYRLERDRMQSGMYKDDISHATYYAIRDKCKDLSLFISDLKKLKKTYYESNSESTTTK